eukprot:scaffold659592_cov43-Prasinocladus_malaysianus.AAC.2
MDSSDRDCWVVVRLMGLEGPTGGSQALSNCLPSVGSAGIAAGFSPPSLRSMAAGLYPGFPRGVGLCPRLMEAEVWHWVAAEA